MKKIFLALVTGLFVLAACAPVQPATQQVPGVETIVAATLQALTSGAPPTAATATLPLPPSAQPDGTPVSYGNVSLILPTGVASSALAGTMPAVVGVADGPGWEVAPEFIKFQLENYAHRGDIFHEPTILVYPAPEYAAVNEQAAKNIQRLQAILSGAAAPAAENLPHVATFNAGQAFAAQIQVISFQNGTGVRFLTEYAQYYVTANNRDLFYMFQGLTADGKYYIIAILPASHPLLASDENPESPIPSGGIPFPGYYDEAALEAYYPSVTNLLNITSPDQFNPTLTSLDTLIQSISIAP